MSVQLKRAYAAPDPKDGIRVLVDGMWPRGLRKEQAGLDRWLREVAPSPGLRKWFGHDPARWEEFRCRYRDELLREHPDALEQLRKLARRRRVTLVFAARDEAHNNAAVLKELLTG